MMFFLMAVRNGRWFLVSFGCNLVELFVRVHGDIYIYICSNSICLSVMVLPCVWCFYFDSCFFSRSPLC